MVLVWSGEDGVGVECKGWCGKRERKPLKPVSEWGKKLSVKMLLFCLFLFVC